VACVAWLPLPDLSSIMPTGCPDAVTGVVPALSWNNVLRWLGSYHEPSAPPANRYVGPTITPETLVMFSALMPLPQWTLEPELQRL